MKYFVTPMIKTPLNVVARTAVRAGPVRGPDFWSGPRSHAFGDLVHPCLVMQFGNILGQALQTSKKCVGWSHARRWTLYLAFCALIE